MNDYLHDLIFLITCDEPISVYFDEMRYSAVSQISSEVIAKNIHFLM